MTTHKLDLVSHPTVITPSSDHSPFEGWGVRIG